MDIRLNDGRMAKTPSLPVAIDGARLQNRLDPPNIGEHTREILQCLGYKEAEISKMAVEGTIGLGNSERAT